MIKSTKYVIAVLDLEASAEYYQNILGFEVREIGDPGWRFFVKDNCCIMAGECPDATPAGALGDHSYFAYFELDDIDAYFETVKSAGGEILKPLRDEDWGMREFALRTIDGHRIMFGQELDF
ncbi:MAG: bleomycin resistance protein [Pseudomonadota bacterium]|jgi:predicted enzyme related to lactoylglutathione lyase|nr:bleomycin resistance protein [Pseudomonadota bacterium]QKK05491.1 MAG: bleomycin resistance protein [Pseudomonadota bacterium]